MLCLGSTIALQLLLYPIITTRAQYMEAAPTN